MTWHEFTPIFAKLALQLRAADADEAQARTYFDVLQRCELELVAEAAKRFARRVDADGQSWFPRSAEWLDATGTIEREWFDKQRAYLRRLPAPLCQSCDDTGWARDEGQRVSPCSCRSLRRLELLGRRPYPALPEARRGDAA